MDRLAQVMVIGVGMLFAQQMVTKDSGSSAENAQPQTAKARHGKHRKAGGHTSGSAATAPPTAPKTPVQPYPPTEPANRPGQAKTPPAVPKPPQLDSMNVAQALSPALLPVMVSRLYERVESSAIKVAEQSLHG